MMIRPITLWLGMYGITAFLFYFETGSIEKGLFLGLISASLKTLWSIFHNKLWEKDWNKKNRVNYKTIPSCCCGL